MADYLNGVPTTDAYPVVNSAGVVTPAGAPIFTPDQSTDVIVFDVGNNPVYARCWRPDPTTGGLVLEPEPGQLIAASLGNVFQNVAGVMFRSAVAGQAAVIIAKRYLLADHRLQPGIAFTGTLAQGGSITPPASSPTVQVDHNGVLVGVESTVDFVDLGGVVWQVADVAGSRVTVAPQLTQQIDYAEQQSNVVVSATTEATATLIVTGANLAYDGATPVLVECFVPDFDAGANTYDITFVLYDGAGSIGELAEIVTPSASIDRRSLYAARRLTPSNANHQYSLRAFRGASNVTCHMGAGGNGVRVPAFIRVSRAA